MKSERQRSAGGVVVRGEEVLLIALQKGRRWQLPKGHIEPGESPSQAAVREVEEETGVRGRTVAELPAIDFWFVERSRRIHKEVQYFLLDYVTGSNADFDRAEVSGAEWFGWQEALDKLTFDNERGVVQAAHRCWQELADDGEDDGDGDGTREAGRPSAAEPPTG